MSWRLRAAAHSMRWKAERWIKLRHFPSALAHSPWFVLRHAFQMMAHTFAGSTVRSLLGLESARTVFERYRQHRRAEREQWTSGLDAGRARRVRAA